MKALLVGTYGAGEQEICVEHLHELAQLADTYGVEAVEQMACPLRKVDKATYIGSGKLQEILERAEELDVDMVIFDDELKPSQQRNLEKKLDRDVLERTEVILGVFFKHAKSREAHLQIEMAEIDYQMPRLKRLWTHLSRQRGGGLAVKGEGEKQIELDKRMLQHKRVRLAKELQEVRQHRQTQRHGRERQGMPTLAIVGYTNAGKSTLLNALTDAGVLVEDQLFATLDTTTRRFELPNNQPILLIDTVGFIRKIPHQLVEAFKGTLEEAAYADILVHVIDASAPMAVEQAEETIKVLEELGCHDLPTITVLNKVDQPSKNLLRLRTLYPKTVQVSALERTGFDELQELMIKELAFLRKEVLVRIPQSEYALVSELMEHGEVLYQEYEDNDVILKVRVPTDLLYKVEEYVYTPAATA